MISKGKTFFMEGHFPFRSVLRSLCAFSELSISAVPLDSDFDSWAAELNDAGRRTRPSITIAQAGDWITPRTFFALMGGANHEAFHRLYSFQGSVSGEILSRSISPHYERGVPYHHFSNLLSNLQNVLEDTRIERLGCAEFPGVRSRMEELADFILDQEFDLRKKEEMEGASPARIALALFRELGLGYQTSKVEEALDHYRKVRPEVWSLFREGGALHPLLEESIPKVNSPQDREEEKSRGGASLSLALRVLNVLYGMSEDSSDPPSGSSEKGSETSDPEVSEGDSGSFEPREGTANEGNSGSFEAVAVEILDAQSDGITDYASALESAVRSRGPESPEILSPYTTSFDEVQVVPLSGDLATIRTNLFALVRETKRETLFLRSRLRGLFQALEGGGVRHGVPAGSALSERYLVDSFVSVRQREEPNLAFRVEDARMDTSISAYIVLDESGSMSNKREATVRILYTLAESLDALSAKFAIVGFRDLDRKSANFPSGTEEEIDELFGKHLRVLPVVHDVYKGFEDRFRAVAGRILNPRATGGTPMSDGIELGLQSLSPRTERFRFLFVVTDGVPDSNHVPVIQDQILRAQRAGISIIGVGMGKDSFYVTDLFPDHVFSLELKDIPSLLVLKLTGKVREMRSSKRGSRVGKRRG